MAEAALPQDAALKKALKRPLLIGLSLALLGGGGGFYAVSSGLLFGGAAPVAADAESGGDAGDLTGITFVPIEPLVISIGEPNVARHLKFTASLEVESDHEAEVNDLMPRIQDVLNGYLRAVDPVELENSAALVRLRAQLLRRIQMVCGEGRVRDILVTEFVLN